MKRESLQKMLIAVILLIFCQFLPAQTGSGKKIGANFDIDSVWQKGYDGISRIPVCWENPGNYTTELKWVKEAAESSWAAVANLQFSGWETCYSNSKGIRINIKDGHPHVLRLGNRLDGVKNGMELNFTFNNFKCYRSKEQCVKWIAMHEFGHAIGLAHEQNRTDCRCTEAEPQGSDGGFYATECDKKSVMNYCNSEWINLGELSLLDIKGVRVVYGERGTGNSRITTTFEDSLGEGQSTEILNLEINDKKYVFRLDDQNRVDRGKIYFPRSGNYNYFISTETWFDDNYRSFSGSGNINIEDGGNYEFLLNEENEIIIRKK